MNSAEPKGSPGFTLLEVMAALTLTGLVIIAALSLYDNCYRVYQHSLARGKPEHVTLLIYERVSELVGAAYQYPFYDERIRSFTGDASAFRMLTDRGEGIAIEELILTDNQLIYKKQSLRKPEEKREVTIFTGITGEFMYMDASVEAWSSDWEEREFPSLLRLDLKLHHQPDQDYQGRNRSLNLPPLVFPFVVGQEYGRL